MMHETEVTAVVVSYNRPQELLLVIDALLNQSFGVKSIVVIDNASTQLVTDILRGKSDKVIIHRLAKNIGGAGGFARGVELALQESCHWLWLMDDDAIPNEQALEHLLDVETQPTVKNIGALCSRVIENNKVATMHRRYFNPLLGIERKVALSEYTKSVLSIDSGSFVSFLIKRAAAEAVGLPIAAMFLAYDDTEYSLRLRQQGYNIYLVPKSTIVHLRPLNNRLSTSEFGQKHYYNIRNRLFTLRKFSRFKTLASLISVLYGLSIWIVSPKDSWRSSFKLLRQAVYDGWQPTL